MVRVGLALRCSRRASVLLLTCALLTASCGSVRSRVQGQVLAKGKPLADVVLTFHPTTGDDITAIRPTGMTGQDGTFTLSSGKEEGAAPGEYVVTAVWLKQPARPPKKTLSTDPPPDPEDGFQGRYADRSHSTLKVTIKSGLNKLEPFNLD